MLVPCRRREGHVTRNMYTYWQKVMNTFVDFVASRKQERVLIDPSRTNIPFNRCLVLNTRAVCSWATRQKISFVEWHASLDGWVVYGNNVPVEWSRQNRIATAPEPEIEKRRTPSKRAQNETPPVGSVTRRTRSNIEHDVGSSKGDTSKSLVIELYDSPIKDTGLSLTTSAVEAAEPPLVLTIEVVPFLSLDFEARTYRRKTTTHRAKTVSPDVENSFGKVNT